MKNLRKPVGAAILSLFVATGIAFLSQPIILTHAETATSDVNLNIGAVMSLSLDADSLDLSTTPHHFVSGVINATVSTNSQYGYTLTLEDVDTNTDLAHTNTAVSDSFSSNFSGSKTSSEMEDNTWGFSLNAADFYKVPVNGSPVALKRTTDPMTDAAETVPVTFGAMVGNIVSGAYTDSILFTIYVNGQDGEPNDGTTPQDACAITDTIHDITSMQQMNKCVCQNTTTPNSTAKTEFDWDGSHHGDANYVPRTSLIDTRDGNSYLVSKMADGNCWMSQNLGYDIIADSTLTSETSDLNTKSSWTPTRSTFMSKPTTRMWPTGNANASSSEYSYHPIAGEDYFRNGIEMAGSPSGEGIAYNWEKAGNYYNWYAVTAGSGTYEDVTSGDVEDSICPKGWRLPKSGLGSKSYAYMLDAYTMGSVQGEIVTAPFNYVLAGNYLYYSQMRAQGTGGLYWTSGASSKEAARSLRVWDVGAQVNNTNDKGRGFTVRCVAR